MLSWDKNCNRVDKKQKEAYDFHSKEDCCTQLCVNCVQGLNPCPDQCEKDKCKPPKNNNEDKDMFGPQKGQPEVPYDAVMGDNYPDVLPIGTRLKQSKTCPHPYFCSSRPDTPTTNIAGRM